MTFLDLNGKTRSLQVHSSSAGPLKLFSFSAIKAYTAVPNDKLATELINNHPGLIRRVSEKEAMAKGYHLVNSPLQRGSVNVSHAAPKIDPKPKTTETGKNVQDAEKQAANVVSQMLEDDPPVDPVE